MLEVKNLSFGYNEKEVLSGIHFSAKKGQHLSLIGESGCGKSTLLKLIYGLYDLKQGEILWEGSPILSPKNKLIPGNEGMKYLAQDFNLHRFHTVEENVGFFLSNQNEQVKKSRVEQLLEMVEMQEFAKVKIKNLSGGQQQRVALATVLSQEPKVLLLDEPFSQIDNFRKNSLRRSLFSYLKEKNILCIVATHDFSDSLSFSDEILVLKQGKLVDKNTPKHLYEHPKNKYIASLFGEVNELRDSSGAQVLVYPHELEVVVHSDLPVQVMESYYRGNGYLVQALSSEGFIYFEADKKYDLSQRVYLKINKSRSI